MKGSPIEFDIASSDDDYIYFANSYLHVKIKITTASGNNLADNGALGPVNYFLHSLFSQVAYIENLLSYGLAAKRSQLTACLFYKDTVGKMHKANPLAENVDERNSGLIRRAAFIAQSRELDLMGRIHTGIFFQSRYILNEVSIKIKLTRSRDVFCLVPTGDQAFKVKITAAEMIIRKVKVSPAVYLAHVKTLDLGTAKYPLRRVVCKAFTIPAVTWIESREII
jgi:hypothetical protein